MKKMFYVTFKYKLKNKVVRSSTNICNGKNLFFIQVYPTLPM
jgi:hypothetical protein